VQHVINLTQNYIFVQLLTEHCDKPPRFLLPIPREMLVFSSQNGYIESMDKQSAPILAKSAPSGGTEPQERAYNIVTMAALQETSDIMSGKKKVKWNRLKPGETKTRAKEELKKIFGSWSTLDFYLT